MKRIILLSLILCLSILSASAQNDVLKILAIGNSFSEDALEYQLYPIAKADGQAIIIGNMYISGCSIDTHVANMKSDAPAYSYRKIGVDGKKKTTEKYRLSQAVKDEKWDYISVQQVSGQSGIYESYVMLPQLVQWIRENAPEAKVVFHQTWAYSKDCKHVEFPKYDSDMNKMYNAIVNTTFKVAKDNGIRITVPSAKAIQSVRQRFRDLDVTRDGFHLDRRFGTYIAAATFYETLSGHDITKNTYKPENVTDAEISAAKQAVRSAVHGYMPATHNPVVQTPQKEKGMYEGHKNYGKSIAVFGGSLSVNKESEVAKQMWADELHSVVTTYGVGGAGFAKMQGYSLQKQVQDAGVHDIYVLWASTNDYTNSQDPGVWSDYTAVDGFDEDKLYTQCGGINYCIKTLLEKNPNAEIYFFTSFRFFSQEEGHNPFSDNTNMTDTNFAYYVKGQKECCEYFCIPVLDQFNLQGINEYNYKKYYVNDALHMNQEGYRSYPGCIPR
ncbi:MAG: DUF4886 domain-containing protein [Bacteroidales bacterium]|nr:DUF4886 domain-containing protein [Bacteroidales bacterium]